MKDYLNSEEKKNIVMCAALIGTLENTLNSWTNLDKQEHKNLRTALTFANKTLDGIYNKIQEIDKQKVQRLAKSMDVAMTVNAKKIYAVVDEEDALNLAELIDSTYCKKCQGGCYRTCRWRNILSLWEIDCIDAGGKCKYSYKEAK